MGTMREFLGIDSYDRRPDGSVMDYKEQQGTIINAIGLDTCIKYLPKGGVNRFRDALKADKHLNNIPIREWDACYKIYTTTKADRRVTEESIKKEIESKYKAVLAERGLIMRAHILIMFDDEVTKSATDFSRELLKIGINYLSPSMLVSLLKHTAILWVEREDALKENKETE